MNSTLVFIVIIVVVGFFLLMLKRRGKLGWLKSLWGILFPEDPQRKLENIKKAIGREDTRKAGLQSILKARQELAAKRRENMDLQKQIEEATPENVGKPSFRR